MEKDSKRCCDTTAPESIHTKDESKRGSAFAFIFGVNWPVQWDVTEWQVSWNSWYAKGNNQEEQKCLQICKTSRKVPLNLSMLGLVPVFYYGILFFVAVMGTEQNHYPQSNASTLTASYFHFIDLNITRGKQL